MNPHISRTLGGFKNWGAHHLMGKQSWRVPDGIWSYLLMDEAMEEKGLEGVETYVDLLNNRVVQYIVTHLIMELCLETERSPGARV